MGEYEVLKRSDRTESGRTECDRTCGSRTGSGI